LVVSLEKKVHFFKHFFLLKSCVLDAIAGHCEQDKDALCSQEAHIVMGRKIRAGNSKGRTEVRDFEKKC
jgi:hypothetical protein